MTKIILTDGVINVKESYESVSSRISDIANDYAFPLIELTQHEPLNDVIDTATGTKTDKRVLINVKHIQCIKP